MNATDAREWRVFQIPNGTALDEEGCINCHLDPAGGGPRNVFGQDVEVRVAPGLRTEFWLADLVLLDSDSDGYANGVELQDPEGSWRSGQDDPGDPALVSFPGDPSSIPFGFPTITPTPSSTLTSTRTPTPQPTPTVRIRAPDLSLDGQVNATDLVELLRRCFTEEIDCDLNLDALEDFNDVLFFTTFWTRVTSHAPIISPFDTIYAREGVPLEHRFAVTDMDGDIPSYELLEGPPGVMLDLETGILLWTPVTGQAGSHPLRIRVSDDGIPPMESSATGTLLCLDSDFPINLPPSLPNFGIYRAYPGFNIELPIGAIDPERQGLQNVFNGLPAGAQFDEETATLRWTPGEEQRGPFYVSLTVTDSGIPPEAVVRQIVFQIAPIEGCTISQCDPATGCVYEQASLADNCCEGEPLIRVPEPNVGCPEGRILFVGRNQQGFGRLRNCDHLQFVPFSQGFGALITVHIEARCINLDESSTLQISLTREDRVLFDVQRNIFLRERDDGFGQTLGLLFSIDRTISNQSLEGSQAILAARVTDADGVVVERSVRVLLTLSDVADIPDPIGEEVLTNEIGCTACHRPRNDFGERVGILDPHPWFSLSCTDCHGGNNNTSSKAEAHVSAGGPQTIIHNLSTDQLDEVPPDYLRFINPGDIRVASFGCGANSPANLGGACHQDKVETVPLSVMSTYAGHYDRPRFLTGSGSRQEGVAAVDRCDPNFDPETAPFGAVGCLHALREADPEADRSSLQSVMDTYLPKSCPTCHLSDFGRNNAKGVYRSSGCTACHMVYDDDGLSLSEDPTISNFFPPHPIKHWITTAIPTEQCSHCHFQGGRIGLAYRGIREGGFPPEKTPPNGVTLGRDLYGHDPDFYFVDEDDTNDHDETPPDLHAEAGMVCADCHIGGDVHGDGNLYAGERYQVGSRCEDCHGTVREEINEVDGFFRNSKGFPHKRIRRSEDDRILLKLAMEDREIDIPQIHRVLESGVNPQMNEAMGVDENGFSHTDKLECYACHTSWRLSCVGCHVTINDQLFAPNRTTGKASRGAVSAARDDYSIDLFALGVNHHGKISPLCNSMSLHLTYIDENGVEQYRDQVRTSSDGKTGFGWNPFHFHTVSKTPINCDRCHTVDPISGLPDNADKLRETYGFGNGKLLGEDGNGIVRDFSAFLNEEGELVSDFPHPNTGPVPPEVRERATSIQVIPQPRLQ